jgi:hypothetical protein
VHLIPGSTRLRDALEDVAATMAPNSGHCAHAGTARPVVDQRIARRGG